MKAQRRFLVGPFLSAVALLGLIVSPAAWAKPESPAKPSVAAARPATPERSASGDAGAGESAGGDAKHGYSRRGHGRHHGRYGLSVGLGWGWPYYGAWASPWSYGGWYGAPYAYGAGYRGDMGAIDFDVWPEKAEVYVDGNLVGTADDFDGFPTYLWLERGTYDVVVYRPGFQTLARQYTVYPGLVIDVEDRLAEGEAVRPEDLASKSTVRRDERLRRDVEREARARRGDVDRRRDDDRDWRDRRRGGYDDDGGYDDEEEPDEIDNRDDRDDRADDNGRREAVESTDSRLRLRVEPSDASVYLDGRFVGTGEELAGTAAGLLLDEGEHTLEVVRPGHQSQTRSFEVGAGATVTLEVELEED